MKSRSSRFPLQAIPDTQTAPWRMTGPVTSVKVGVVVRTLRLWAKWTVHTPVVSFSELAVDSIHEKSAIPGVPALTVGNTTAPDPLLTLKVLDHVAPWSLEKA